MILWYNISVNSEKTLVKEMKYIKFRRFFKNNTVFRLKDIRLFEENFDLNILSDWQKQNYIKKIRKGLYIFTDIQVTDTTIYHIANKIYEPSYLSFESALSNYGLIPEMVFSPTSATSKKTAEFPTDWGIFYYRHLKPELMFGYRVDELNGVKYKFAKLEKAVLDYFYINSYLKSKKDLDDARFDYEYFFEQADKKLLMKYLERFSSKALSQRIQMLAQAAKEDI